ncbi:hypothetical protein [Cryptosporangium arvum]|nr:hypothetical protein [Cryptosporangium arvum]
MIDPHGDRAVYRQLADQLRANINSGEYGPGSGDPLRGHVDAALRRRP